MINIYPYKILICFVIFLSLVCGFLFWFKSQKETLCEDPISTDGNMEIVNRQCIYFGDKVIGLIDIKDKNTGQIYHYVMNVIDGDIIFNLNTAEAVGIKNAKDANMKATIAVGLSAAALSSGKR